MIVGYYYLHENGELIYKPGEGSAADIRDSPFAIGMWAVDPNDRSTAWNLLVEAFASGVDSSRIHELAWKWGCNDKDAGIYASKVGCLLGIDGDQKTATRIDFLDIQESPCGFGDTYLEAMADLTKQLGYKPNKMWRSKFEDLMK